MKAQAILSVALLALGVGSSGWKPISPPRGTYQSKSSHEPSNPFKFDEFRFSTGGDELSKLSTALSPVASSEIFFKSPTHSYKTFSSDHSHAFTQSQDLDILKKEPLKSYKPQLSYDESKRAAFNSISHNFHRKPIKNSFLDKPELSFSEDLFKNPFLENEIRPLGGYNLGNHEDQKCSLYKVAFRQDLYFQYIQYKMTMPDLKEFTLCMWNKFSNHTNDHPLFSYAIKNQPKALALWVSTTDRSNYLHMSINGHPILRLNYPIRLNRWYHTCSSWNGKTGEWQVWVNAERIGRGFHNLLVGHVIKGGGIAITGQEQRQLGGGFLEGPDAPKGSGGFLGEVTMVQLYKVALTAGKAYNDHRTHHSLHASTTPVPPPQPTTPELPTTVHPFLENGQLKPRIPVFELAEAIRPKFASEQQQQQQAMLPVSGFDTSGLSLLNNPFHSPFISSLDASALTPYMFHFQEHNLFKRGNEKNEDTRTKRNGEQQEANEGENTQLKVKYVPTPQQVNVDKVVFPGSNYRRMDKHRVENEEEKSDRQRRDVELVEDGKEEEGDFVVVDEESIEPEESEREGRRLRRPTRQNAYGVHGAHGGRRGPRRPLPSGASAMRKQEEETQQEADQDHDQSKRQIFLGDFGFGQLLHNSDHFPVGRPVYRPSKRPPAQRTTPQPEEEEDIGPVDPVEPAEGEVRRIMGVCSGCDADPYRKVAVISWRSTPKKIYSGALYLKAKPECRRF